MSQLHHQTPNVGLPGSERRHRKGSVILYRCEPGENCDITVKVRRKAELPEPDPARPMDRAEIASIYGADPADLDKVASTLEAYGLTVKSKSVAAHAVEFSGPVSAMEAAFGTKLSWVKVETHEYRGRTGALDIPASLAGIVTGIFGLDTRPMIKHHHKLTTTKLDLAAAQAALPPANTRKWFSPQELATAYQFPVGDGSGQSIAVLEFAGHYLPADLKSFLKLVGLPGEHPTVDVKTVMALNPSDANDLGATGEVMLDVEVVAALVPKARIVVLFSPFTEQGWIANLDAILSDPTAPTIVSVSYGLAEGVDPWSADAIAQINDTLKGLANAGVTVCISSGDDGSDDQTGDGQAHVDFPAASPFVLAVGGTSLDKSTGDEIFWFEGDGIRPPRGTGGSGGGGVSQFSPRPNYQQGIDIPSANPGGLAGRIIPDVAANAAGGTGYIVVAPDADPTSPTFGQSLPFVVGGTSASTPLFAALLVRIQQAGKTVGFLTPRLYAPTPATGSDPLGASAFRDITSGNNASGGSPGYDAGPGFDALTGWGSPRGQDLLDKLS